MRTDAEMEALIRGLAEERPEVRAVWLNGSRANPTAPRDALQDFDVVFAVTDTAPMLGDRGWLRRFGEVAVMQEPDASALYPCDSKARDRYAFLIQFADGARLDLTLLAPPLWFAVYREDPQTILWLDKDGAFPPLPPPTDRAYWLTPPTAAQFISCCNEFWWVAPYVGKGLWRGELLYAVDLLNEAVRPMLLRLLGWQAGYDGGFGRSAGKCCKYLPAMLSAEDRAALYRTYPPLEPAALWAALEAAMDLFSAAAPRVAARADLPYDAAEEAGSRAWLRKLRAAAPGGPL